MEAIKNDINKLVKGLQASPYVEAAAIFVDQGYVVAGTLPPDSDKVVRGFLSITPLKEGQKMTLESSEGSLGIVKAKNLTAALLARKGISIGLLYVELKKAFESLKRFEELHPEIEKISAAKEKVEPIPISSEPLALPKPTPLTKPQPETIKEEKPAELPPPSLPPVEKEKLTVEKVEEIPPEEEVTKAVTITWNSILSKKMSLMDFLDLIEKNKLDEKFGSWLADLFMLIDGEKSVRELAKGIARNEEEVLEAVKFLIDKKVIEIRE